MIAWSGGPLHSENDFYSLIENHVDKALRLFVYNSDLEYVLLSTSHNFAAMKAKDKEPRADI